MNEQTLDDFLSSDIGHNMWDSNEVRIILKQEVVFILKMNAYVELDELNLINEDNEFTPEIEKYVVEDYKTIDGTNHIFIKEKRSGIIIIAIGGRRMGKSKEALEKYLEFKQNEVMRLITPICNAFGIYYFDYEIDENQIETLVIEKQRIACSMNSFEAIIEEVLGYIIVKKYQRHMDEKLKDQLYKVIKRSWHKEGV